MIVEKVKYTKWISIGILVTGLLFGIFFGGLNMGLDFTGGRIIDINMGQDFNVTDVNNVLNGMGMQEAPVVKTGNNWQTAQIRIQETVNSSQTEAEVSSQILSGIQKTYPDAAISSQNKVGAVASQTLIINAFLSVLIACGLMMLYIWVRFELYPGVGAIIAILHDVAIMICFMSIF